MYYTLYKVQAFFLTAFCFGLEVNFELGSQRKTGASLRRDTLRSGLKPLRFSSLNGARKGSTQPNSLGFFISSW
jgi:hypothetical protein